MSGAYLQKISKSWARMSLVSLLFIIVAFAFAGEKVAINDGIGWDGEIYYNTMQHFITMIKHQGYDQYAIPRIMPWGLTQIVCVLWGVKVTRNIAIASGIIYNVIALIISVFYFFRISNLNQWKQGTEVLGFAFLFFTYPILKLLGYYPLTSDIFGFTLGIMMCYYFLANKKVSLILCGFFGAFLWPTSYICAFALAFFPRIALPEVSPLSKKSEKGILKAIFILLASIPLVILLVSTYVHNWDIMAAMRGTAAIMLPRHLWIIPLTCLCTCLYYYYMVSAFNISLPSIVKQIFAGKNNWMNYLCFAICVVIVMVMYKLLANSNPGSLTTMQALERLSLTSMAEPFIFVESHFVYYGIGYLLVLILWKHIAPIVMRYGLGYLFVVAMWVLFSTNSEARIPMMFWVFPLIALLMYLDQKEIHPYAIISAIIFMLIHSRFWYHINVPNMEKYLSWENYYSYQEFPAQRYFMSQGPWQAYEIYVIYIMIAVGIGTALFYGIRKKWFLYR